jgi:hypothetical protein
MPLIRIDHLSGSMAGRSTQLDADVIRFGRAAGMELLIDHPHVSREHGTLRYAEDRWWVENHSPNGTTVNGRDAGRSARALQNGDIIGVGDDHLFAVFPVESGVPAEGGGEVGVAQDSAAVGGESTAAGRDDAPVRSGLTRRSILWMGISVYLVGMVGLFIVLAQVAKRGDRDNSPEIAEQLTRAQIAEEIASPLDLPPSPREARQRLIAARALFHRRQGNPGARFEAYQAFREAQALSGGGAFEEGLDQIQYAQCREELIDAVTERYNEAYFMLRSGRWAEAEQAFRELAWEVYPDKDSAIWANVQQQLAAARARAAQGGDDQGFQ